MTSFPFTDLLQYAGFAMSAIALKISLRKDVHKIRIEVSGGRYSSVILGVNNDSVIDVGVLCVGYYDDLAKVTWIEDLARYVDGKWIPAPAKVQGRSQFQFLIPARYAPPEGRRLGVCVQLETGRIYTCRHTASLKVAFVRYCGSLISRLTRGAWAPGFDNRPRLPPSDEMRALRRGAY